MKKLFVISALLILASIPVFAHPGHAHVYKGTVSMLHGDNSFMMETANGDVVTVQTTDKTSFVHATGHHKGKLRDLAEGMKIVVKMSSDGKTASSITMGSEKK